MRGAILGILAGSALAFSATAANATITVNSCSASLDSCTANNTLAPAQSSIAFSDAGPLTNPFSATIDFTNSLAGNYFVSLNTADPFTWFDTLTITPFGGGPAVLTYGGASTQNISLLPGSFGSGQYLLNFTGHTTQTGGNLSGTLSFFQAAVPEPGTWALMLLGFGGIGMAMRRRRRTTALAQIA